MLSKMLYRTAALLMVTGVCLSIVACAPSTQIAKELPEYQRVNLDRSPHAPERDTILAAQRVETTAVVNAFELPSQQPAKRRAEAANLGQALVTELEKALRKANVKLIDRAVAKAFIDEVELAETRGEAGSFEGPKPADFALLGRVTGVDVGSSFTQARQYEDDEGNTIRVPPKCTYSATVVGSVKVYRIPETSPVKVVTFLGDRSTTEETPRCRANPDYSGLVRPAGAEGIRRVRSDYQSVFASRGYVVERRVSENGKKNIFRITMGRRQGLDQGDRVAIYTVDSNVDPLTEQRTQSRRLIAEGKVTDIVDPVYAWILVSNEESANRVRMGDEVKTQFKGPGFFESMIQELN